MGRVNQSTSVLDRNGDGLVNNAPGTRGIEALDIDGNTLMRASSADDGTGQVVFVPVDLSVQGQTTEIEDVITGQVTVEDEVGNVVADIDGLSGVASFSEGLEIPSYATAGEVPDGTNLAFINGELSYDADGV